MLPDDWTIGTGKKGHEKLQAAHLARSHFERLKREREGERERENYGARLKPRDSEHMRTRKRYLSGDKSLSFFRERKNRGFLSLLIFLRLSLRLSFPPRSLSRSLPSLFTGVLVARRPMSARPPGPQRNGREKKKRRNGLCGNFYLTRYKKPCSFNFVKNISCFLKK